MCWFVAKFVHKGNPAGGKLGAGKGVTTGAVGKGVGSNAVGITGLGAVGGNGVELIKTLGVGIGGPGKLLGNGVIPGAGVAPGIPGSWPPGTLGPGGSKIPLGSPGAAVPVGAAGVATGVPGKGVPLVGGKGTIGPSLLSAGVPQAPSKLRASSIVSKRICIV